MNLVALIGNLTRDPDLRYSTGSNPTAVCRFTIAVNDGFGDNQKTSYIPVIVFGKSAENCSNHLRKGSKVAVNGKIQTGSYEKDGKTVYTTDVIANNFGGVEFLSKVESIGKSTSFSQNEQQSLTEPSGFTALDDDNIPF